MTDPHEPAPGIAPPSRPHDGDPAGEVRSFKYRRAALRRLLLTVGPDRLSGGRLRQRHLDQAVDVRRLEITLAGWPADLDGLRIGHVTDFHLGELCPLDRAIDVVGRLGEEDPDLVVCTGDVVDLDHDEAEPLLRALGAVRAPWGSALVLGNHDELHDADALARLAERSGLLVLRDRLETIAAGDRSMSIAGIDWARSPAVCAERVDLACPEGADLLLAHNPKAFQAAVDRSVPLTLSGHTHGGQVALPKRPGANLAFLHGHTAGLYGQGDSRLFVSRGVGAWFPLRINCPPEAVVLTVRSGERDAG